MKSKILLTLMAGLLTMASSYDVMGSSTNHSTGFAGANMGHVTTAEMHHKRSERQHLLNKRYVKNLAKKLADFEKQDNLGTTHTIFGIGTRYQYPANPNLVKFQEHIRSHPNTYSLNFKQLFPSETYAPVSFTARGLDNTGIDGKPGANNDLIDNAWQPGTNKWADPEDIREIPAQIAAPNNRKRASTLGISFDGKPYALTESYTLANGERVTGYPKNPRGDTGIVGRGELGLWGANFAADPVLIRRTDSGKLEVLLVKRLDGRQWSLPGGMFDPEDKTVSVAAVRELAEETGITQSGGTPLPLHDLLKWFKNITVSFGEVYTGYCDDPRNTDNAWMETTAYLWLVKKGVNFHINKQGDETVKIGWFEITPALLSDVPVHGKKLFASHAFILRKAVRELLKQRY